MKKLIAFILFLLMLFTPLIAAYNEAGDPATPTDLEPVIYDYVIKSSNMPQYSIVAFNNAAINGHIRGSIYVGGTLRGSQFIDDGSINGVAASDSYVYNNESNVTFKGRTSEQGAESYRHLSATSGSNTASYWKDFIKNLPNNETYIYLEPNESGVVDIYPYDYQANGSDVEYRNINKVYWTDATTVNMGGLAGHLIAPYATVNITWCNHCGSIVANNINTTGEDHVNIFLPPTPETSPSPSPTPTPLTVTKVLKGEIWSLRCDTMDNTNFKAGGGYWMADINNPTHNTSKEGHRSNHCGNRENWVLFVSEEGKAISLYQLKSGSTGGTLPSIVYRAPADLCSIPEGQFIYDPTDPDDVITKRLIEEVFIPQNAMPFEEINLVEGQRLFWISQNGKQVWHHTGVLKKTTPRFAFIINGEPYTLGVGETITLTEVESGLLEIEEIASSNYKMVEITNDEEGNYVVINEIDPPDKPTPTPPPPVVTPTPTPSPTPEETESPSPTPEETETPSPTPEETESPSPTPEETETPSPTPEETETPTSEETETPSPTPEETETPSPTPEETESPSPTPEESESPSPTPEETETPSPTPEETETPSPTPDITDEPSPSPEVSESPSPSPEVSESPSPSPEVSESPSPSPEVSESPSPSPSPTPVGFTIRKIVTNIEETEDAIFFFKVSGIGFEEPEYIEVIVDAKTGIGTYFVDVPRAGKYSVEEIDIPDNYELMSDPIVTKYILGTDMVFEFVNTLKVEPSPEVTETPTPTPTTSPIPSEVPTETPTPTPTETPTPTITTSPIPSSTPAPTPATQSDLEPTEEPTKEPTEKPTEEPIEEPTKEPTEEPTEKPTEEPTKEPTETPAPVKHLTVQKIWDDQEYEESRPESIVVRLYGNYVYIRSYVIASDNYLSIEMPYYDEEGNEIEYTWSEESVIGYTLESIYTKEDYTTIINRVWIRPEKQTNGKKPRTVGRTVTTITFEDYETPLGVNVIINHVGDCFD